MGAGRCARSSRRAPRAPASTSSACARTSSRRPSNAASSRCLTCCPRRTLRRPRRARSRPASRLLRRGGACRRPGRGAAGGARGSGPLALPIGPEGGFPTRKAACRRLRTRLSACRWVRESCAPIRPPSRRSPSFSRCSATGTDAARPRLRDTLRPARTVPIVPARSTNNPFLARKSVNGTRRLRRDADRVPRPARGNARIRQQAEIGMARRHRAREIRLLFCRTIRRCPMRVRAASAACSKPWKGCSAGSRSRMTAASSA